jgi:peptide deformylase
VAVLEILTYPDDRLRQVSEPVKQFDAALQACIDDLEETRLAGPGAVGIAAAQVAWFQRVLIVDVSGRKKTGNHGHLILVNPEITEWDGFAIGREGCLSVPDYTGNVVRAERIQLDALDRDGNPRRSAVPRSPGQPAPGPVPAQGLQVNRIFVACLEIIRKPTHILRKLFNIWGDSLSCEWIN